MLQNVGAHTFNLFKLGQEKVAVVNISAFELGHHQGPFLLLSPPFLRLHIKIP